MTDMSVSNMRLLEKGRRTIMKEQSTQTKKGLMKAAISVFYENGFQKARVSDIVAKAGVAQGTFYLYFKSKEEIFQHLCSEFITTFTALLEEGGDLFAGDSYAEVRRNLHNFIRKLIVLYVNNAKIARILFCESGSCSGQFKEVCDKIYSDFISIMRTRLEQNCDSGHVSFEDAETEATFLVGLFDRSLFYFIDVKKKVDTEALSRRMTDFIMGGLAKHRPVA